MIPAGSGRVFAERQVEADAGSDDTPEAAFRKYSVTPRTNTS